MCEPVTLLAAGGVATGLAGSAVGAYGAYEEGQAQGRAMDANAVRAREAARDAVLRGAMESGKARMVGTRVAAEATATAAASGVDVSSGSAADAAAASKVNAEMDAQTIKNNAAREAWGLKKQAEDFERQGYRARQAGKMAAIGGILGGLGGAASGAAGIVPKGGA